MPSPCFGLGRGLSGSRDNLFACPAGAETTILGRLLFDGEGKYMTEFVALWAALFMVVPVASAQRQAASNQAKLIARGKYLVSRVAMCGDCHSPHNQRGEEIPERELTGAPLAFSPSHPVPGWVAAAPPIAGLEGWTNSEAVRFLMTGLDRSNKHPGPPMPHYLMSRRDAEAAVAYLKSLHIGK